jgi:hypothetical protein
MARRNPTQAETALWIVAGLALVGAGGYGLYRLMQQPAAASSGQPSSSGQPQITPSSGGGTYKFVAGNTYKFVFTWPASVSWPQSAIPTGDFQVIFPAPSGQDPVKLDLVNHTATSYAKCTADIDLTTQINQLIAAGWTFTVTQL